MSDMKLSQLVDGAPALAADLLYLARAGGLSRKLSITNLFANIPVNVGLGIAPLERVHLYGSNQTIKVEQNPGIAGNSTVWLTAAGGANYEALRFALAGYIYARTDASSTWHFGPDTVAANAWAKLSSSSWSCPAITAGGGTPAAAGRSTFSAASEPYAIAARHSNVGGAGSVYFGATDATSTPGWQISLSTGSAAIRGTSGGLVGVGMVPTQQFELSGSVGQKASGTTWANPSDARIKEAIEPADLDRCCEIVKSIPLRRYTLKLGAFSGDRVRDRSKLGWIAQEVQPLFAKAVKVHTFQMEPVPDGLEEVDEPVLEDEAPAEEAYVEIVAGVPVQKTRIVARSVPVVDMVPLTDELGAPVLEDVEEPVELDGVPMLDGAGAPLTKITQRQVMHPVPRMRKVQRAKVRRPEIPDCLALDADQIYAAMYGAVQRLIQKVEVLEAQLAAKP